MGGDFEVREIAPEQPDEGKPAAEEGDTADTTAPNGTGWHSAGEGRGGVCFNGAYVISCQFYGCFCVCCISEHEGSPEKVDEVEPEVEPEKDPEETSL